jgi:predicted ArsR family transcriptional regulator
MREIPPFVEEEEEEGPEEKWPFTIRCEIIEYLLRRYGSLQAKDVARILGCKIELVRQTLRQLERFGRVRKTKLGRNYIWSSIEEERPGLMYF